MLRWVLLLGTGLPLVESGPGHIFASGTAAHQLGWPAGNPFQNELGFWDFAAGVGAGDSLLVREDFKLAVIIINAIFWISAGALRIQHALQHRNYNIDNAVPAAADILDPVTFAVLLLLTR